MTIALRLLPLPLPLTTIASPTQDAWQLKMYMPSRGSINVDASIGINIDIVFALHHVDMHQLINVATALADGQ